MKVTVVIPARFGSTRFPGKPLIDIFGKTMIQRVYDRVSKATLIDDIFVATDDNRIAEAVHGFSGKVILTSGHHQSGTDRVSEVAKNLSSDIFINVQGDEPFVSPKLIDQIASSLISDKKIEMSSAGTEFKDVESFLLPQQVKVICDHHGFALYFSRWPIPFMRSLVPDLKTFSLKETLYPSLTLDQIQKSGVRKHLGIYGFRRDTLLSFAKWEPTSLEICEGLEQLRALEHGLKIKMVSTQEESISIDTPQDLERIIKNNIRENY